MSLGLNRNCAELLGTSFGDSQPLLDELDRIGYGGFVGLEYRPQGTTEESLTWLEARRRSAV